MRTQVWFRTIVTSCWIILTMLLAGCAADRELSREQIVRGADYDICEVVTTDGQHILFKEIGGRWGLIRDSSIVGLLSDGKVVKVPISQVSSVRLAAPGAGEEVTNLVLLCVIILGFVFLMYEEIMSSMKF